MTTRGRQCTLNLLANSTAGQLRDGIRPAGCPGTHPAVLAGRVFTHCREFKLVSGSGTLAVVVGFLITVPLPVAFVCCLINVTIINNNNNNNSSSSSSSSSSSGGGGGGGGGSSSSSSSNDRIQRRILRVLQSPHIFFKFRHGTCM